MRQVLPLKESTRNYPGSFNKTTTQTIGETGSKITRPFVEQSRIRRGVHVKLTPADVKVEPGF